MALRLLSAPPESTPEFDELPDALRSPEGDVDLRQDVAIYLHSGHRARTQAKPILLALLARTPPADTALRDCLVGYLFLSLKETAPLAFSNPASWSAAALPEPYLPDQGPEPMPPRILEIKHLHHVRLFRNTPVIDAPLPTPDPEHGQWIVLVGENGSGKTTLLRALALALAETPAAASRLLDENQPFLSNGGEARIALTLDTGPVSVAIRREGRTEVVVATDDGSARRPWVVGYGVRRGNARGEKDRPHEFGPTGELHTLFEHPAALVAALEWLPALDHRVLSEERQFGEAVESDQAPLRPQRAIWNAVCGALKSLLGITEIKAGERPVRVVHPHFGEVPLDALSDGYLTTAGWVIDLIARWVDREEKLGRPIPRDLLGHMTGVVLLDEIDLHLHPMWQMHVIERVGDPKPGFAPPRAEPAGPDRQAAVTSAISRRSI